MMGNGILLRVTKPTMGYEHFWKIPSVTNSHGWPCNIVCKTQNSGSYFIYIKRYCLSYPCIPSPNHAHVLNVWVKNRSTIYNLNNNILKFLISVPLNTALYRKCRSLQWNAILEGSLSLYETNFHEVNYINCLY